MSKGIVLGILLVFLSSFSFAKEQYALKEGLNCVSCHYNPSGGGPLNIKGRYYERHDLSLDGYKEYLVSLKQMLDQQKDKKSEAGDFISSALERISLQGKIRTLFKYTVNRLRDVARDNFDLFDSTATFGFQVHNQLTLVYTTELNTLHASDAYITGPGPFGSFFRIGQFTAPFGLTVEDHTIMVRSLYGLSYYLKDTGLMFGVVNKGIFANASILNAFRQLSDASSGTNSIGDPFRGLGVIGNIGYQGSNYIVGMSGLFETTGEKNQGDSTEEALVALFSSISFGRLHLSGEIDWGFDKGIGTGIQSTFEKDESALPVRTTSAEYVEPFWGKITSRGRPFGDISFGAFAKLTYELLPKKWDTSVQYDMLTGNFQFIGDAPVRITGAMKYYPWKNFSIEPQFKYNITPNHATANAKNRNKHQVLIYASASF